MIGQLVGHYKVVRKIGDGGMGSVFEAVHEGIGRHVAIKVLRPQYSKDSLIVTRFFNEARAVNIVTHPGIVGSFDYGQLPDGTAYIVMEYCDGESLSGRIKRLRGPFGPDSLRIGRQIAAALAAAHSKGIVHRDLKPEKVVAEKTTIITIRSGAKCWRTKDSVADRYPRAASGAAVDADGTKPVYGHRHQVSVAVDREGTTFAALALPELQRVGARGGRSAWGICSTLDAPHHIDQARLGAQAQRAAHLLLSGAHRQA